MSISVVIPVIGEAWFTKISMHMLRLALTPEAQIIVVDNGSQTPYVATHGETVLRSEINLGSNNALAFALPHCKYDVVSFQHNDFYMLERDADVFIAKAFADNPKLAMAGLFTARGVAPSGGRFNCESRMMGLFEGKAQNHPRSEAYRAHSNYMERKIVPAVIMDAMCMIVRKSIVEKEGLPENLPHHFADRIWPLWFIERGYDVSGLGIPYDHASGLSSSRIEYYNFAIQWCKDNNITIPEGESPDMQIYRAAENLFLNMYAHKLPLIVLEAPDGSYVYRWRAF